MMDKLFIISQITLAGLGKKIQEHGAETLVFFVLQITINTFSYNKRSQVNKSPSKS